MSKHEPTTRKLEKARNEGQLAKSIYITQSAPLLFILVSLYFIAPYIIGDLSELLHLAWSSELSGNYQGVLAQAGYIVFFWSLVLLMIAALFGLFAEFAQVGFNFNPTLLLPKLERVDPVSGSAKIFKGLAFSWAVALRAVLVAAFIFWSIKARIAELPSTLIMSFSAWSLWFKLSIASLIKASFIALTVNSVLDYFIKWRSHRKQLMMTDEELRQEVKDDEGDPHYKHHRKHEHRSLISQDIVKRMRKAKVLIVERSNV